MSIITRHPRTLLVGAACAVAGGGIGVVANAGASTAHATSHSTAHARRAARGGRLARLERRAVHAELTVHTKQGFETITIDRGTVDSVSGDTLTLTEGTRRASGAQVSVTIPAGATIRSNRTPAALSALTPGERVLVVTGPAHTSVRAHSPRHAGA